MSMKSCQGDPRSRKQISETVDDTDKTKMREIQRLQREVNEYRRLSARDNCPIVNQMYDRRREIVTEMRSPAHTEERKFTQACPSDGCRGFLSQNWKCGVCDSYFCPDCHKKKAGRHDPDHVCNEEDKATVALIKADSRPCPNCGQAISKVDGCDQMWCTSCHTPFSWRTGKKISGRIHNPHYMQYQREGGEGRVVRVAGDVQCGGPPHVRVLDQWSVARGFNGFSTIRANLGGMNGWRLFNFSRVENLYRGNDNIRSREISENTTKARTYMAVPTEYPPHMPSSRNDIWVFVGLVYGMIGCFRNDDDGNLEITPVFGVIGKRKYTVFDVRARRDTRGGLTSTAPTVAAVPYGDDLLYYALMSRTPHGFRSQVSLSFEDEILPLTEDDERVCKSCGLMWAGVARDAYIGAGIDNIRDDFFTKHFDLSSFDPRDDDKKYAEGKYVADAARIAHHITDVMIPRHQTNTTDETCQALRVKYLMGEIDEPTWRQRLKAIAKKTLKNRDTLLMLDMAANTITDVLLRFCSHEDIQTKTELTSLRDYTNSNLRVIGARFGNVVQQIAEDWSTFE